MVGNFLNNTKNPSGSKVLAPYGTFLAGLPIVLVSKLVTTKVDCCTLNLTCIRKSLGFLISRAFCGANL
jgi:hypothetical protein